ncbi:ABC transporter ATP-binding protein [Salirhabdus salicampi]|uniref:ABC transporter ATP-binding protein n=1 Tax=Salirhabdus salicampi TaxID=476102 RepID=UPI0020C305A9|nr:ABC transporter ATP-binding protein [Salirhabdus salicampi]MCP8615843.1 ABC transporter ATP-binding protein [Salirhabdus salicampi]
MEKEILVLDNLYKHFGDVKAVNGISIDIKEGELISFIGPSGCGKTTLLRIIGGFHEQDSGDIILDGSVVNDVPPNKRSTGMVFQNYALFPHMTVYDNIAYGLKQQKVSKAERDKRIKDALAQVQLAGYGDRKPSQLSGGQQQRVAIARCLVLKPKVLLLDEPLSNLDANLRMDMREEIRRLKEELNLTIIFVTHDQEEALSISDRIAVLNKGVIQQLDRPDVVYNQPANEFVANFVGHVNILEGSIESKGDDVQFKSEDVQFDIVSQEQGSLDETKAVIRPESITIDDTSSIKGTITKYIYNGSFIRYYVQIGEHEVSVDEFDISNMDLYQKGDTIGIRFTNTPHLLEV